MKLCSHNLIISPSLVLWLADYTCHNTVCLSTQSHSVLYIQYILNQKKRNIHKWNILITSMLFIVSDWCFNVKRIPVYLFFISSWKPLLSIFFLNRNSGCNKFWFCSSNNVLKYLLIFFLIWDDRSYAHYKKGHKISAQQMPVQPQNNASSFTNCCSHRLLFKVFSVALIIIVFF